MTTVFWTVARDGNICATGSEPGAGDPCERGRALAAQYGIPMAQPQQMADVEHNPWWFEGHTADGHDITIAVYSLDWKGI